MMSEKIVGYAVTVDLSGDRFAVEVYEVGDDVEKTKALCEAEAERYRAARCPHKGIEVTPLHNDAELENAYCAKERVDDWASDYDPEY